MEVSPAPRQSGTIRPYVAFGLEVSDLAGPVKRAGRKAMDEENGRFALGRLDVVVVVGEASLNLSVFVLDGIHLE